MIKRLIILLIGLNSFVYAQNEVHLIYVDNYKSIKNNELLKQELDLVVHKTNIQFLLYCSGTFTTTDLSEYDNSIDDILLRKIRRPSPKDDIRFFSKKIDEEYGDLISIGEGITKGELHFHFFSDIETCKRYRYDKKFVNKLLLIYNLRNKNGLKSDCFVHYHINYEENQSDIIYDNYLKSLEKKNTTIKTY